MLALVLRAAATERVVLHLQGNQRLYFHFSRSDIVQVQTAYWQKQFSALTAQAEEVRALSTKAAADTAEPIKAHVTNGMNELRKVH